MEYPHRITNAEQLQATRPKRSRNARQHTILIGTDKPFEPPQSRGKAPQPQVSVVAIDPGGTACPPVHRNGAQSKQTALRVQHVGGRTMKLSMLLWLTSLMPQPVADQACLATTVYLEARSEPTIGQLAVAEVALRRRDQGRYGKTVCAVVTAPHQFATTTTPGSFDVDNLDSFHKAWLVASKSILNWQLPVAQRHMLVPRADHFATVDVAPVWSRNHRSVTIGEHAFYAVN
jgi:Cell Wall Hydrolase